MRIGALEAGGTKMVCAIGDENGNIFKQETYPTLTPNETMPKLIEFYKNENIETLGIACFGPIDINPHSLTYGYITTTTKLAWQNFDIVGTFEKELNVPIGFDTDVNGSALGEYKFGIGKSVQNLVYITVGTGVGIGVISEGRPIHGMMHPEGGHVILSRHPKDNYKGKCPFHENCVEGLAGGPAVEERWGKKAIDLVDKKEVWELESYYLAQALIDYTMILSPEMIIMGGGIMHNPHLLKMIKENFVKMNNGYIKTKRIEAIDKYIVLQSLDDKQGILGALYLGRIAAETA